MECFNTTVLALYVDQALEPAATAEVTGHLATCLACQQRFEALQEGELLALSSAPMVDTTTVVCAENYTAETLSGYLSQALPAWEEGRLESHLPGCQRCRLDLIEMQNTMTLLHSAPLLMPPAALANHLRTASSPAPLKALGAFVIQVMQHGLRFVEALRLPPDVHVLVHGQMLPAGAFRSALATAAAVTHVDIEQQAGEVALRLNVLHVDRTTVLCTLGLHKHGLPLRRRRIVLLRGHRRLYAGATSDNGEIDSLRLEPGEYTVQIPQEHLETVFILRAAAPAA